jgi:transmembrane sensor
MTDPTARRQAAEEALLWWAHLRQPGVGADVEQQFFAWLQSSPLHVEEYLRVAAHAPVVSASDLPAPDPTAQEGTAASRRWPARRSFWALGALCSVICVLVWSTLAQWRFRPTDEAPAHLAVRTLTTGHAEVRTWTLADGSEMQLGPQSVVIERYSPTERLVQLRTGHADFHVAKGDRRRFRVLALGGSVVATGTRFDVNLDDQRAVVTLVEGRVVVYANPVDDEHAVHAEARAAQPLVPGEQVSIAAGWVSTPARVDVRRIEAWKRGQIVAEALPLAEVVREFNRYAERPIRIEGRDLAMTRLSGVFNVRDEASFLAFLKAGLGVEGVADTQGLRLRARSAIIRSPNTEVE